MDVDLSVPLLLGGSVAAGLFPGGVPDGLCLPGWLAGHPDEVRQIQRQFAAAGCGVLCAPTFGAGSAALARFGLEQEMEAINRALVAMTRQAAGDGIPVAGVLAPTGMELEPFGEASYTEVMDEFREQAAVLADAGADLLIAGAMGSIAEARAAAIALRRFHLPVIVTLRVDEEGQTADGGLAVNALIILQELGIAAFGLDCPQGPAALEPTLRAMTEYAKVPLLVCPAAVSWESESGATVPLSPEELARQLTPLIACGASLVSGTAGATPAHLEQAGEILRRITPAVIFDSNRPIERPDEMILADRNAHYHLYCDQIECSEPLHCSPDMCDEFLRLEEERIDVIVVELDTADEAREFAENAHFATLPVSLFSHDEMALRLALLLYTGKALVDSRSSIEEETLAKIARKYGAIIY